MEVDFKLFLQKMWKGIIRSDIKEGLNEKDLLLAPQKFNNLQGATAEASMAAAVLQWQCTNSFYFTY